MPNDENAIIDAFVSTISSGVSGLKTCEAFEGTIDEAIKRLMRHPSVLVYIESTQFSDGDEAGELLEGEPVVTLLIGSHSLRGDDERRKGAYSILKASRGAIHNVSIGIEGAIFKVIDQALVDTRSSISIYRQRYRGHNVFFD